MQLEKKQPGMRELSSSEVAVVSGGDMWNPDTHWDDIDLDGDNDAWFVYWNMGSDQGWQVFAQHEVTGASFYKSYSANDYGNNMQLTSYYAHSEVYQWYMSQ
ncbi:hypothetical protein QP938_09965 [Porticoccaceae bacterium LTM1]|nr:hypothetical protein QP938_09965 [Porticoccaceae bacterium LTM1]